MKVINKIIAHQRGTAEAARLPAKRNEYYKLELLKVWKPYTVKTLQKTVLEEGPTLVFLIETKYVVSEMARIKRKLERQQCLVVPSVNRGGGLALLWKNSLTVDVQTYSPRHIDAIVTEKNGNRKWRFTGFFGHPETNRRMDSWKLIEQLSKSSDLPWLIMGDFNEIMHLSEKVGENLRPEWQMLALLRQLTGAS